jgi:hypothetical protein
MRYLYRKFWKLDRVTIYMKSGNRIVLDDDDAYTFAYQGDTLVKAALTTRRARTKLLINTINLEQIEAVTVSKY